MERYQKGFRIGEFAQLAQVSKDTLYHYEKIGILSPTFIDETNGYRYYSGGQFFRLQMIKALRESGLSLEEIREFSRIYKPKHYLQIMNRQKLALEEQISQLTRQKDILEKSIEFTESGLNEPLDAPVLRREEEEYLIVSNYEGVKEIGTPENESIAISRLIEYCAKNNIDVIQPLGAMISREDLIAGNPAVGTMFFPLKEKIDDEHVIVKPAGTYLVMYHKGLYSGQKEAYGLLLEYIRENGLEITGAGYELEVCGYLTGGDPKEFIIRYAVQIGE